MTEFGMTPSSRVRLGVTSTEPVSELDRWLMAAGQRPVGFKER